MSTWVICIICGSSAACKCDEAVLREDEDKLLAILDERRYW